MAKIIDRIRELESEGKTWFSLEFFPPKSETAVDNLVERVANFSRLNPVFVDITWGAGGSTAERTLELSDTFQNVVGVETQMHLTCTNMPVETIRQGLKKAYDCGVKNLVCLRGDPARGADTWSAVDGGLTCAKDLVQLARAEYGDYFGISVAGYPEGHPEGDYQKDLQYLKEKVDAGGELIITQLFYDVEQFLQFVSDVRAMGITAPILPGIMPIQNYGSFKRMVTFCKTKVPQEILDALEPIKDDDEAVKAYGVDLAVRMCQRIIDSGIRGLHFYTMNLEKTVMDILSRLGLASSTRTRDLPWTASKAPRRQQEDVRPIFWSNRPRSYLARTDSWDDFPNGRWGDLRSPAFGDISEYHWGRLHQEKADKLLKMYGSPSSEKDIFAVCAAYCRGEIAALPWNDTQLAKESSYIRDALIKLNLSGFLTTNSQPSVNGVPSSDPAFGWGRHDGYIYQKAYVEFFTSAERLEALRAALSKYPSLQLIASNRAGQVVSNMKAERSVTAVTWGVFPGREIVQPTVVDTAAFMVWKDEAFQLLKTNWVDLYAPESPSRVLLENVLSSYYLVSLVDNDFMTPNSIFRIFDHAAAGPADSGEASA